MNDFEKVLNKLKKYGQEHLINFYDELNNFEKNRLISEIENIDFELIENLYKNKDRDVLLSNEITVAPSIDKEKLSDEEKSYFERVGIGAIKNNEVAICQMAGGQGTRLGHSGPKGTFIVELDRPKSIFEVFADRLKIECNRYGTKINWYIMTSKSNDMETKNFFEKNNYFEYDKNFVKFFPQGQLPLVDKEGNMILARKDEVYQAADGNGGIFKALHENGVLKDMEDKGVKYLAIGNIDNILLNLVDPLIIGMMKDKNCDLSVKSIVKRSPDEKVGVICKINGRPGVVEYTEISENMANMRDENGELLYGETYFGCAFLSAELLKKICNIKLPYHAAFKKNKYINNLGEIVEAKLPNTYKFEMFIFDAFNLADDMLVLRVKREDEFAPIKNKDGDDSPETAIILYKNFHKLN